MGETAGRSGAAIGRLRQQIEGLVDADLILPEDGQWLLAALTRTLQGLTTADSRASRSDMQGVIERLQSLMQTGVLGAAAGEPPVDLAHGILASLRGLEEGAASAGPLSRFGATERARVTDRG
jgi:hypothetical protein